MNRSTYKALQTERELATVNLIYFVAGSLSTLIGIIVAYSFYQDVLKLLS